MARDVHWCVTVDYQQIANDNIANQIHGFTIVYGKFILIDINCKHTPLQCNMCFISTLHPRVHHDLYSLITFGIIQRGIVTLFRIELYKSQRVSSRQLNSKTNDLILLLKTIWRFGNCFLSPVSADGMDGNELKLEKNGHFFQVLTLRVPKILNKLWCALSDKIHLISSSSL